MVFFAIAADAAMASFSPGMRTARGIGRQAMFRYKGEILIVGSTVAWGASYLFTKTALNSMDALGIVAFRYSVACVVTALIFHARARAIGRSEAACGGVMGALLFCSSSLLSVGLESTTVSNAGFIIGSMVLVVAILDALAARRKPHAGLIAGVLLAMAGIAVLTLREKVSINPGDVYCLGAMLSLAFHVMAAQRTVRRADPIGASVVQFATTGALACAASLLANGRIAVPKGDALAAIAALGVVGTAAAFVCQVVGQKHVSPTRTAFLFTLEPIFATLFAWMFIGEPVPWQVYVGGGLLLAGVYVSEYRLAARTPAALDGG